MPNPQLTLDEHLQSIYVFKKIDLSQGLINHLIPKYLIRLETTES